ncbi:Lcl C-terminal domain-containing protein [Desulfonatronum parangueonense]
MREMWRRIFGTAALAFMLCLTGLVLSGEAQAQRFVDNGNGTVTDTVTWLMWTKDANPIGQLNWHDAMSRCSSFSISGIGGWRLPSRDELVALYHPMQGGHPFSGVQSSYYWSSTTHAGSTDNAWNVSMSYGSVYTDIKSYSFHVWPVRAGQ